MIYHTQQLTFWTQKCGLGSGFSFSTGWFSGGVLVITGSSIKIFSWDSAANDLCSATHSYLAKDHHVNHVEILKAWQRKCDTLGILRLILHPVSVTQMIITVPPQKKKITWCPENRWKISSVNNMNFGTPENLNNGSQDFIAKDYEWWQMWSSTMWPFLNKNLPVSTGCSHRKHTVQLTWWMSLI